MEVLGSYLNHAKQTEHLVRLLALPTTQNPRPPRPVIQQQRHLTETDQLQLVASYQSGKTVYELATQFDINRKTVSAVLKRQHVTTRWRKLTDTQIQQAIALYETGLSEAAVAEHFGVYPSAIHMMLKRHDVPRRPNGTNQWA